MIREDKKQAEFVLSVAMLDKRILNCNFVANSADCSEMSTLQKRSEEEAYEYKKTSDGQLDVIKHPYSTRDLDDQLIDEIASGFAERIADLLRDWAEYSSENESGPISLDETISSLVWLGEVLDCIDQGYWSVRDVGSQFLRSVREFHGYESRSIH